MGLLGTGREGTAGRGGNRAGSQHLTPAALLYRAAVTRSQVKYGDVLLPHTKLKSFNLLMGPSANYTPTPLNYVSLPNS